MSLEAMSAKLAMEAEEEEEPLSAAAAEEAKHTRVQHSADGEARKDVTSCVYKSELSGLTVVKVKVQVGRLPSRSRAWPVWHARPYPPPARQGPPPRLAQLLSPPTEPALVPALAAPLSSARHLPRARAQKVPDRRLGRHDQGHGDGPPGL